MLNLLYKCFYKHRNEIIEWLKLPCLRGIQDYDQPEFISLRGSIIQKKGFLRKLYIDFYKILKNRIYTGASKHSQGSVIVELGSNGGFIKDIISSTITSDIVFLPNIDMAISAMELPFKNNSINTFLLINVLHHFRDPYKFFCEAERCLTNNGKMVMIEPANSIWGKFIYKNFHHEPFDTFADWKNTNLLMDSNGALPWIIFYRDRNIFEEKFPSLCIKTLKLHTPTRYIISGGVSMRQLLPDVTYNFIKGLEILLSPLNRYIGMFLTIELEKL
ncbi:MAG: methyltransferase domain-containing protein [Candidatus Omnitrophota bacterium]|nr:methyltransferase domain-containing protein [Candidatus Omnitrophota bacterium]